MGLPPPHRVRRSQSIDVCRQTALILHCWESGCPTPSGGAEVAPTPLCPLLAPGHAATQLALHRQGPGLESRSLAQGPESAGWALYSPWLG